MIDLETAVQKMKQYVKSNEHVCYVTKMDDGYMFSVRDENDRYGHVNSDIYVFVMDGISSVIHSIDYDKYVQLVDSGVVDTESWLPVDS